MSRVSRDLSQLLHSRGQRIHIPHAHSPVGCKEFLAQFHADARISGLHHCISESYRLLSRELPDHIRESEVVRLSFTRPGGEIPHLPIVPIVCKPHLGSDEEDASIVEQQSTVVQDRAVQHWPTPAARGDALVSARGNGEWRPIRLDPHSCVDDDVIRDIAFQDLLQYLPAMQRGVLLQKVIKALPDHAMQGFSTSVRVSWALPCSSRATHTVSSSSWRKADQGPTRGK